MQRSERFGRHHVGHGLGRLVPEQRVGRHARGVEDAVDPAVQVAYAAERVLDVRAACDVGPQVLHLGAEGAPARHALPQLLGCGPAPEEGDPGPVGGGEVSGQDGGEAAGAAGDHIHTALAEGRPLRRRPRLVPGGPERPHLAHAADMPDLGCPRGRAQLARDGVGHPFRAPGADADGAAVQVRGLGRQAPGEGADGEVHGGRVAVRAVDGEQGTALAGPPLGQGLGQPQDGQGGAGRIRPAGAGAEHDARRRADPLGVEFLPQPFRPPCPVRAGLDDPAPSAQAGAQRLRGTVGARRAVAGPEQDDVALREFPGGVRGGGPLRPEQSGRPGLSGLLSDLLGVPAGVLAGCAVGVGAAQVGREAVDVRELEEERGVERAAGRLLQLPADAHHVGGVQAQFVEAGVRAHPRGIRAERPADEPAQPGREGRHRVR